MTRFVDAHVHCWDVDDIPLGLRTSWAEGATFRRPGGGDVASLVPRVSAGVADPDGSFMARGLAEIGVSKAVLLGVDYGEIRGTRAANDPVRMFDRLRAVASAAGVDARIVPGVDPRRPDALDLVSRFVTQPECAGVKFYPPAGFDPGEPEFLVLYERIEQAGKAAVFHTGTIRGALEWKYAWPPLLTSIQARFQGLKIVVAHAGYPCWWDEAVAVAASHPRTYLEISLWQRVALRRPTEFLSLLENAVATVGADRVVFGSDSSFGPGARDGGHDAESWLTYLTGEAAVGRLGSETVQRILRENAEELYFEPAN